MPASDSNVEPQNGGTRRCDCGADVAFEEIDRGQIVYCPSCGAGIMIPEAASEDASEAPSVAEETQKAPPTSSVFSGEGLTQLQDRVVATVPCLCGQEVEVHLQDYDDAVYCPSCGSAVPVTRSLKRTRYVAQAVADEEDGAESTSMSSDTANATSRRKRVLVFVVGSILVVGSLAAAVTWTSRRRDSLLTEVGSIRHRSEPSVSGQDAGEFDAKAITCETVRELLQSPEPFRALMLARSWRSGLQKAKVDEQDERLSLLDEIPQKILKENEDLMVSRVAELPQRLGVSVALERARDWRHILAAYEVPPDDARIVKLNDLVSDLMDELDPITVERIDSLPNREHAPGALLQAELWRQRLAERRLKPDDPRLARLEQVIQHLEGAIAEVPQGTPQNVADFLGVVQQLADSLGDEDLAAARLAAEAGERMLGEHGEMLSLYQLRFVTLKDRLDTLQSLLGDFEAIRELLKEGKQVAGEGDVESAMEYVARARLRASAATMTRRNSVTLKDLLQQVERKIRYARGRRAVEDAKRCDREGDVAARNREVRRAMQVLPGLPEDSIAELLEEIRPWENSAIENESADDTPTQSPCAKRIAARNQFAATLEHFAHGDFADLMSASLRAHTMLPLGEDELRQLDDRLVKNLLELLRTKTVGTSPGDPMERAKLAAVYDEMVRVRPWQGNPQWAAIRDEFGVLLNPSSR